MKYLSYEGLQYLYGKILTRLGLKVDATNGDISSTKISTFDTLSTEFPVPVAGENTKTVLGKIKKFITDFNSLKSSLLLLGMLTSQYENNTGKIPTAALVYALKQSLDATNSNLSNLNTALEMNTSDISPLKSTYVPDINNNTVGKVNIVTWDVNTESTPYKTGDTTYGNGFCITYSVGDLWLCQFAMAVGDSRLFTRNRNNGVWSGWTVK